MYGPFTALPSPAARGVCRVVPSPDTLACDSGTATTVTEDYGPSLARGRIEDLFCGKAFSIQKDVLQEGSQGAKAELDRDMFTRLYHVAGLRVPAAESGILVSTLRRHLLNWPRIKNVVRVPGDSVSSDDSREVVKSSAEDGVAFWRKAVSVRVVEDKVEEPVLGTRLLLLDEKYANKQASELPPALQELISRWESQSERPRRHLAQCELVLSYAYWHVQEVVRELLPAGIPVPSAFETVGHIAHLNLRDEHFPYK